MNSCESKVLFVLFFQDGQETKLEKAKITLNDCLACSGCITSAESVLITQQSQDELYRIFKENKLFIEVIPCAELIGACETNLCVIHAFETICESILLQAGKMEQQRMVVISVSPQARASLAAKYQLNVVQAARKLTAFFKKCGKYTTVFTY